MVRLSVRWSLHWWTSPALDKGCVFADTQKVTIRTDASLYGWGAHLGFQVAQGRWSPTEAKSSINLLELWAIYLAVHSFQRAVQGHYILILMDNVVAKAYVNQQGRTQSKTLLQEVLHLGRWAEATSSFSRRTTSPANKTYRWTSSARPWWTRQNGDSTPICSETFVTDSDNHRWIFSHPP